MKKLLLFLVVIMAFSFAACSESLEDRKAREVQIYEEILASKKPYEKQTEEERKIVNDHLHNTGSFKNEGAFKKPTPSADSSI